MNKLNTTIILSLILMLTGCAANTDEAPSATTAATTTTVAATTQATTTSAQTTAVTEQSEPVETTAVTTTVATTTTATTTVPEIVEADQIADERQPVVVEREEVPDEYKDTYNWDKNREQTRRDMAENTGAYTTDGIPLTTDGGLTAPVKPTADYVMPEGVLLEFKGDASTALTTELPEGCFWFGENSNWYVDPAGNYWLNTESEFLTGNSGEGYRTPTGKEYGSQKEIDAAIAFNEELAQNDGTHDPNSSNIRGGEDIAAALGW